MPPISSWNSTTFTILYGCEYKDGSMTSKGFFQGDDPMKHPLIVILIQLGTAVIMTTFLRRILHFFNQPRFVAEMLTGIILGPSIFQHFSNSNFLENFNTPKQTEMISSLEFFSTFMLSYLVGMQIDFSVIRSTGKLGWILGISAFVLPNVLTKISSTFLQKYNPKAAMNIEQVALFCPITAYPVIVLLLKDIKLLNSEIGRLAVSSSIISNICGWFYTTGKTVLMIGTMFKYTAWDYIKTIGPRFLFVLFGILFLRPFMYWLISNIPEGKKLKQWHFVTMILILFAAGFYTEILGYSAIFGGYILGMIVPSGPPLGSGMVEKANLFVTAVLVPSYLLVVGNSVNLFLVDKRNFWTIMMLLGSANIGKIIAAAVPMRVLGVPKKDALALGLILCSQGLFDVITAKRMYSYTQINQEYFTMVVLMITLNASIATPILRLIYNPSKRYINYKRRTIQHSRHEAELKTLVCIHEEDDVFGIMNLIKAIYPTKSTPIHLYGIDLVELMGRLTPVFINHQFHRSRSPTTQSNRTERILSAFQQFENQHEGLRRFNFTAIAPYNSMHDEICSLALDKSVSLVIVPFHKSETIPMRGVKRNVLEKAPCSVGILVDKRIVLSRNRGLSLCFHVCVVFLGGPDAREALALAMRMLENPSTRVTVIHLIAEDEFLCDMTETKLDLRIITEVKSLYGKEGKRVQYKEVMVKDGAHTIEVLRCMDNDYDFMLVGRRLEDESPLVAGLVNWTYEPELGIVGDVLASADIKSTAPVLVIQQQSTVEDLLNIDRAKKLA